MQPIFNCFSGDTEFITNEGVKQFNDFSSGDSVEIVDKNGEWREATVRKYPKGKLQTITLQSGQTQKKVRASYNHRWILRDGVITTDIKVGDRLQLLPEIENNTELDFDMFALGFLLGDGNDFQRGNSSGVTIRLCGDKVRYAHHLKRANYTKSKHDYGNGDVLYYKRGFKYKENFLNAKVWKYLNRSQINSLMEGYISADGCCDRNQFHTADKRVYEMLMDIAPIAGCYITSSNKKVRDTNFKDGATLYTVYYRTSQVSNKNWIVKDIDRSDLHKYDLWCVEEPITKSFTLSGGIVTGNCCVINLKDMLDNGTVINGKMVETPKSFQVACTVATQIVAQVASNQYGLK